MISFLPIVCHPFSPLSVSPPAPLFPLKCSISIERAALPVKLIGKFRLKLHGTVQHCRIFSSGPQGDGRGEGSIKSLVSMQGHWHHLCLLLWHCLILNGTCKRLRGRISMEKRWFAFQDLIHYKELMHFICSACQHRGGKTIFWSFIVSVFTLPFSCCGQPQISMQWWMLFITKGWSGKWSKMSALGRSVWLEYIL